MSCRDRCCPAQYAEGVWHIVDVTDQEVGTAQDFGVIDITAPAIVVPSGFQLVQLGASGVGGANILQLQVRAREDGFGVVQINDGIAAVPLGLNHEFWFNTEWVDFSMRLTGRYLGIGVINATSADLSFDMQAFLRTAVP